jgi:hypothetical protein
MGFMRHRFTNVAALMGGTAASTLLGGETDGLSIDFTDASLTVRDTTTTSNGWTQLNGDVQTFWRDRSFTSYASPSPKITRDSSGNYTYTPHNLAVMSEEFNSAAWTKTRITVTSNSVSGPTGYGSADTLTCSSTNASGAFTTESITSVASHPYSISVAAKLGDSDYCIVTGTDAVANGVRAWFNLSTGAVGSVVPFGSGWSGTSSITDLGGGWYRLTLNTTAVGTTLQAGLHCVADADSSVACTNAKFNYFVGFNVNRGPAALTYTKTQAHNLIEQSQTLGTTWTASSLTVGTNDATAPDGTATADSLALVDASAVHSITADTIAFTTGLVYTFSFYAKANTHEFLQLAFPTGSSTFSANAYANFNLSTGATSAGADATAVATLVGSSWYRCSITATATATATTAPLIVLVSAINAVRAESYDPNSTNSAYGWGAAVELASSPGKYVATTTAAVYSANYDLPREWNSSGVCQGLLVEEARTNICLYASDLTNAAWTKSNMTTALTATGPDGVANTATTCTATAGNATALQAITSGSAARITSMFVKRRTGTGNIDLTQDNGTTWATQTVTSSWTRVNIASVTSTNPTVGIRIVTSGDAVDIALFQHEVGAFVTSPIYTGSASVTRAADAVLTPTTVFPLGSAHTLYMRGSVPVTNSRAVPAALVDSTTASAIDIACDFGTAAEMRAYSENGAAAGFLDTTIGAYAANTFYKMAIAAATNDANAAAAGVSAGADDTTVSLGSFKSLDIGSSKPTTAARLGYMNGYVAQIMYLPRRMTNAELQAITT